VFDGEAFGQQMVEIVRGYVDAEIAPLKAANEALTARIKELEARPIPEKGDPGERGEDGASPDPEAIIETVGERLKALVDEAVAALPPPEKGDPGEKGQSGERGEKGEAGANGKDGAGIIDSFISRDGHLIVTLSDGTTRDLGEIIGKDGRDGEAGKDGRDGFGFDDMDACVLSDDRTIELSFRRGEEEKAFTFKWPTVIYRNVFKEGEQYDAGDMVTWGGSLWHCDKATTAKPGTEDWTLACKRGRDGKDAK
jgi:integrin beta 3